MPELLVSVRQPVPAPAGSIRSRRDVVIPGPAGRSGSRRPRPSRPAPARRGRARSSPAAAGRGRSPSTGRRSPSPRPSSSRSVRENAVPGLPSRNASRSNSRVVSGSSCPPRVARRGGEVEQQSPSTSSRGPAVCSGRRARAQHRRHPQREFARAERLRDVVVRTELESGDAVLLLAEGGQHHHRHIAAAAQLPADLEPAHAGHHHVQHDEVRRAARRTSAARTPRHRPGRR